MKDFNLLISCARGQEKKAASEMWYIISSEFEDPNAQCHLTGVSGLIKVKTSLNPFKVIKQLKEMLHENPLYVRYALKITPIEIVTPSDLPEIINAALTLAEKIPKDSTYKININKRHSSLHSHEIIDHIAPKIARKVDLTNPHKILNIEIIGTQTGLALISPSDILSISKIKSKYGLEP
ncbi:MAG: THUMP domain-containing protein [Candidatus Odinarchaeia archaeon]